eukprot:Em0023g854a
MTSLTSTLCRYATHKNIRIGDYNIHDCDAKPTKDKVKMASQVLSKLAATSPDKTISIPTDGLPKTFVQITRPHKSSESASRKTLKRSYDMQLAFINQPTNSTSSFSAYCVELHKLQMLKAKYAECKDELADLEEVVIIYVAVCLGKDDSTPSRITSSNRARYSIKVKRQQYFGGVFVGNHIHKVLKPSKISIMCSSMIQVAHEKCPTLVDTVSATAEKFTTVFSLLGRCPSIYDQLFIDELKVTELEHAISEFMESFRASFPSSSISFCPQNVFSWGSCAIQVGVLLHHSDDLLGLRQDGRHSFLLEHYPPAETAGVFCGMQRATDGRILPIFEERLTQMGAWLSINGEAIYGNVPWRVQNDTVDRNTWYTASKDGLSVYAITFVAPTPGGEFVLTQPVPTVSTSVTLLGYNWILPFTSQSDGVQITFPVDIPFGTLRYAWTIKMTNVN